MRIKLGRKQAVKLLPFTGYTFCGCRYLNGDLFEPCKAHRVGKHHVRENY